LAPAESLEFVASFLNSHADEIAERAALALGESRLAAAFPLLKEAMEHTAQATLRRTLLLAMAMLRQDEAVEFLLTRLAEDGEKSALDVLTALSLYSRDDSVRNRIQEILAKRKSGALQRAFEKDFGAD
jgi:HEAT repeat protein